MRPAKPTGRYTGKGGDRLPRYSIGLDYGTLSVRALLLNLDVFEELGLDPDEFTGYKDLLRPELKGRIAMGDPTASSSAWAELTNMLLVMGDDKLPGIRVPCYAADLGLKNTLILHNGVFAPRGTPEKIRNILAHALQQAVESEEFQTFATQQMARGRFLDAADWAEVFAKDEESTAAVAKFITR